MSTEEFADSPILPELVNFDDPSFSAPGPRPTVRWRLGLVLLVVSMLGTAAIMPFSISLMRQAKDSPITPDLYPVVVVVTLILEGGISALAIAAGVGFGRRSGLGPWMLDGVDLDRESVGVVDGSTDRPQRGRAWKALVLGAVLGLLLGGLIVGTSFAMQPVMPKMETKLVNPTPIEGFLASIGAGAREEVWLRLGLMTFLAWLGMIIGRKKSGNSTVIWSSNVLAALVFGAIHLPQAAMLIGLTPGLVAFVFIGNGLPGIVFGWLFWRRGLVPAMVAHFMLDIVLKVILPAIHG